MRATMSAEDAVAMQCLAPLIGSAMPWTPFSMRPAAILAVVSDVIIHGRRTIVECGSGNSTIYVARALRQNAAGGRIIALEHDERWAGLTRRLLEMDGLTDHATVIHAPLVDGWYDRSAIPRIEEIDLLVVDGPPAYEDDRTESRAPALDFFAADMARDSTVILDDAHRQGERQVLERWMATHDRTFVTELGGYAISAPQPA
jgi:predicted O-methyltransferase YrrM